MLDLLVAGGSVVVPGHGTVIANIGVEDGRIVALSSHQERPAALETLDAGGKVVLPGGIDPHVHPAVYIRAEEDIPAITRFAALGGITSIVAFYRPTESFLTAIPRAIDQFSALSYIDFGYTMGITQEYQVGEIPRVVAEFDIPAFKFYMGYKGMHARFNSDFSFDDTSLISVFEALRATSSNTLLCVHCETAEISSYYQELLRPRTEHTLAYFEQINPVVAETDAAIRVSLLGHLLGVRVYIVHLSSGSTAEQLGRLPWFDPTRTIVETCPHYLSMDVHDPVGLRAIVRPPIRRPEEVEPLWDGIRRRVVTTIRSDNCANNVDEKPAMGVWQATLGFGDMGLTLPLLLSEGYHKRWIPLETIAAITSENVAKAHLLYPRKGAIQVGSDADLVVVDLEKGQVVDATELKGRIEGSVYAGRTLKGWPVATVCRGRVVAREGRFVGEAGHAQYLRRPV